MKNDNPIYTARLFADLSGIPVRVFRKEELIFMRSSVKLPKDPMVLFQDPIFRLKDPVSYYFTPEFHLYGIVNAGPIRIVAGPTTQVVSSDQALRKLAFRLEIPKSEQTDFVSGMKSIRRMPFESFITLLCAINYNLSGEELELKDIVIQPSHQKKLKKHTEANRTRTLYDENRTETLHNTLHLEKTLMYIVEKGDTDALQKWINQAPPAESGIMASDQLRQVKNTFIVTATLVSRAAIRGGMDLNDAFTLSDGYIQQAELKSSPEAIVNLQYHMIMEFTEQVKRLHRIRTSSDLAVKVSNYIQHHLSEPIRTETLAKDFFLSRTHFSTRFKEETGMTLTDFILAEKTEEAKRLLRYSDQPAAAIGDYLGFSSPGHFSRVFRKYAGMTPNEYRKIQES